MPDFIPTSDADFLQWVLPFSQQITADPVSLGLTAGNATTLAGKVTSYQTALGAATDAQTRGGSTILAKDNSRADLEGYVRQLARAIQGTLTVTDQQRFDLGLPIRDTEPSPIPPPALAPIVTVLSVTGRVVRYKLADAASPSSRARPANATGALILSYVGETPPPSNDPGWKLEGATGKTTASVQFPNSVEPGTKCWVTAMWMNARGEFSPACDAVQTYLQIGPVAEAA